MRWEPEPGGARVCESSMRTGDCCFVAKVPEGPIVCSCLLVGRARLSFVVRVACGARAPVLTLFSYIHRESVYGYIHCSGAEA